MSIRRPISEYSWPTVDEIRARFTADQHAGFMRRAIALSRRAGVEERTGGAFGAVVVDREGRVVGEGFNHVVAGCDPTRHGEMEAIRDACARLRLIKLDGCLIYSSAEPCPMCLAASYWAGLDGIVYASEVGDAKQYGGFDDTLVYEEIRRADAADRLLPQFQILRDEAVAVWREYAEQPDNPRF